MSTTTSSLTVIRMPDPEPQPLRLVPRSTDETKGFLRHKPVPIEDRLVAGVVAQPVSLGAGGVPDPHEFPTADFAGFAFFLVHLTVTTKAVPGEQFVAVQVAVPLEGDGDVPPIAWSVAPDRLVDHIQVSHDFSINAALKIVALGAVEVGPGVSWKRGASTDRRQPFLLGECELTPKPNWLPATHPCDRHRRHDAALADGTRPRRLDDHRNRDAVRTG